MFFSQNSLRNFAVYIAFILTFTLSQSTNYENLNVQKLVFLSLCSMSMIYNTCPNYNNYYEKKFC